jgi:5-oxoprolinase (ATP-hydrolysing) subunit B
VTAHRVPRFLPAGDSALTVELGDAIDPEINARVLALDAAVTAAALPGIIETVPTYRSLTIHYDPGALSFEALTDRIRALETDPGAGVGTGRLWRVPVCYGGRFGIDLDEVAARHGLAPEDVIARHSAARYRVYMIGFAPGFAYLGGLDEGLHTPRRTDPRERTPSGSVSIGGMQAAISSVEAPSGWHLLGRTPARTFDLSRAEPFLLSVGDSVRFEPVAHDAWESLVRRAEAGEPVARCEVKA